MGERVAQGEACAGTGGRAARHDPHAAAPGGGHRLPHRHQGQEQVRVVGRVGTLLLFYQER